MNFNKKTALILICLVGIVSNYLSCTPSNRAISPHGIILISLDDLRADHLGIYGYHRDTSPYIDAFAKEGVLFEDAVAQANWTLTSHTSMMTSLYPSFHGVSDKTPPLADEHVTIAELLLKAGYQTAAFTDGGWMRPIFGLNQGFESYYSETIGIAKILPMVKRWLNENKSRPFFLFIHCYDIHIPYGTGKSPYDKMFHDFVYTGHLTPDVETINAARENKIMVNDEDVRHFIALYDGGIRYTDTKIGELLTHLKETALYDQSLIIITSDHGEEFKEHGSFDHWQLYYRPNLHVPLIMRIPSYSKKNIRIKTLVQSVDILPTILEIAGLPSHQKAQGRSLIPLIDRQKNVVNDTLLESYPASKNDEQIAFAESPKHYSIIKDGYQLIYNMESHAIQLYDLKTDPYTQNNIAKERDDISSQFLIHLQEFYKEKTIFRDAAGVKLDEKTLKELKTLGYIQ